MDIGNIGIIGAGVMGCGIAAHCLLNGLNVTLVAKSEKHIAHARHNIGKALKKNEQTLPSTLVITRSIADLNKPSIILESINENFDQKIKLLEELESSIDDTALILTNTSTFSISSLALALKKPDRFLGFHFMNPANIIPLVEIIPGQSTSEKSLGLSQVFANKISKHYITAKDKPGFIVNRLLFAFLNQAFQVLQDGSASIEDIDKAMVMGASHKIGPLKLADLIGLDICLDILESLSKNLCPVTFKVPILLQQYVESNFKGRKVGKGFYDYSTSPPIPNYIHL